MPPAEHPVLWSPDSSRVERARVTAFRAFVNRGLAAEDGNELLGDYAALHRWSVASPADFWSAVWDFCAVVGEKGPAPYLADGQAMPGARWFPSARLNFAENLLEGPGRRDRPDALIYADEAGRRRQMSLADLRDLSGRLAASLAADGVGPGVRVAGFLPNIPEAVVAMLAVARLGGVWSSCSPDFGAQGVLDRFGQIEPRVLLAADGYHYGGKAHGSLDLVRQLGESLPGLQRTVVIPNLATQPTLPVGAVAWSDYIAEPGAEIPDYRRLPFAHPLFIMFSSGTTGLPKCMVHSAGGTLLQHLKEHQLHCDLGPEDRLFYFTTCGWMMWNWLVTGLASGAAVCLYDGHPLRPESVLWEYAARERVTVFGTSARHIAASAGAGVRPAGKLDLGPLRCVLSTGSPLLPESFDYVYQHIKADVQLSSISGGTDIISCFALGSPVLPVRRGELQCRGLGMAVGVFDESGQEVVGSKGELVCTRPFPSQPTGFWNDPDGRRYRAAYFDRFPGVWCHGDFAEITPSGGMVIHGRSDTVLNPGGVRIGTAEIYRVVEKFPQVRECLAVGQQQDGDVRIILFVLLREAGLWDSHLELAIKGRLRHEKSPRHVPALVVPVPDLPRTLSGKLVEKAVANILNGRPVDNAEALANPAALDFFREWARTDAAGART